MTSITIICPLCAEAYDASKLMEYICGICKITICETCKRDGNAIQYCDPCQMDICAECHTVVQCDQCNDCVCEKCGGTQICNKCGYDLCEECNYNHNCE